MTKLGEGVEVREHYHMCKLIYGSCPPGGIGHLSTRSFGSSIKSAIFFSVKIRVYTKRFWRYILMQSDGNRFWGDAVLGSFNKASKTKTASYTKDIKSKKVRSFIMLILILNNIVRKYILSWEFLVVECCISLNMSILQSLLKFKILIIKISKYLLFIYLVYNSVFIPLCHVDAVQDDISVKSVTILIASNYTNRLP